MSRASLILFLTCNVIFMNQSNLAVAQNECNVNADCSDQYKVCCKGNFFNRRECQRASCAGRHCSTDGDCGGKGECCISNQCVTIGCPECYSYSDCATSEYCCKQTDHNVCRRSCVGETCLLNSDCGGSGEYQCDSNFTCTKSESKIKNQNSETPSWVIMVAIIVAGIILLVIIGAVVFIYHRCYKHSQPGVVLQQSAQGAAQPHLPKPTAPPQNLKPPRNPYLNLGRKIVRSQIQDALDITSPEESLDFTSLQSFDNDATDMGEVNFDCAM